MPTRLSSLRLAGLLALSSATLNACATSPGNEPAIAADPVVEVRTITVRVCPPELALAVADTPRVPADAHIEASPAGLRWISALIGQRDLFAARLKDAKEECPK